MFRINLKHAIATVAVIVGALAVAGPASACSTPLQNTMVSGVVPARSGQARFIESQYVPTSAEVIGTTDERRSSAGFKSLSGLDSEVEFHAASAGRLAVA